MKATTYNNVDCTSLKYPRKKNNTFYKEIVAEKTQKETLHMEVEPKQWCGESA